MEEIKALPSLENAAPQELAEAISEILDSKKGLAIKVVPVAEKTDIADYFVLCTGTSGTHVKTLADEVEYQMGLRNCKPLSYEGRDNRAWILLDYGTVVVHIFSRDAREFYNLDKLYRGATASHEAD